MICTPTETLNPVDAKVFMSDMFDMRYGIYNHIKDKHPLSTVMLHQRDDFITESLLFKTIEKYRKYKIADMYNISLHEFMDLPPYVVEFILSTAEEELTKTDREDEELLKKMEIY